MNNKKKKKNLNFCVKASFTIEAAVVVPITMIVIVALIYVSFYAHDNVVMNSTGAYEILDAADGDMAEGEIAASIEETLKGRLITASGASALADVSDSKVSAFVSADFYIPLAPAARYFSGSSETVSSYTSISNLDGRAILLKYKTIIDKASGILDSLTEE